MKFKVGPYRIPATEYAWSVGLKNTKYDYLVSYNGNEGNLKSNNRAAEKKVKELTRWNGKTGLEVDLYV